MKKNQKISTLQKELHVKVEKDTGNRLEKFILENHVPKGYVVNEAIARYLDLNSSKAHTHKSDYLKEIGLTPGIEDIIKKIKSKGFDKETTQLDIQDAIRAVRGNDPRTLRNWMKALSEIEFIKEKTRINWKQAIYVLDWSVVDESLWPDSIKNRPMPQGGIESESY